MITDTTDRPPATTTDAGNTAISVLEALYDNVLSRPRHNFIGHHNTVLTYEEFYERCCGFAQFLMASGLRAGDRVCLIMPRVPELLLAFFSVVMAGGLPVPVNYMMDGTSRNVFIRSLSPAFIVVHEKYLYTLDNNITGGIVLVGKHRRGLIDFDSVSQPTKAGPLRRPDDTIAGGKPLYLNYTTGSTGTPKGALATNDNIAVNTIAAIEAMGFRADDVHLCMFASFAHPHELFARALYTGASVVLLEEINPRTIAATIARHSVTAMMGLTPMYEMLLAHCKGAKLDSLRVAESGGMYTPAATIAAFKHAFGVPILSVWGSTETSGIAIANTPQHYRMDGSMGRVCPHYAVRCLRQDGSDADIGEVGEMVFEGRGVIAGFYEDSPRHELNTHTANNTFHSGDLAYRDAEGYLYFVERRSGLIKVAGIKVYPLQIEIALRQHPDIAEAAVIGIDDKLRGMVPKAFVVLRHDASLSEADILAFCKATMAATMVPKQIELRSELPKIGSGKVDKKALR
ncbi:MAG: AMP-binding protein [Magnetococcales bacterium]|nr:AMP-binding protein [Nitrospirota bacterium]